MDYEERVCRAGGGDVKAFVDLTRQFQHFAFGVALALVHDFHKAEDVVQESFVAAWSALPRLAEPAAFPGWLRGIVRHQAFRMLRKKALPTVPLAEAEELPAEDVPADRRLEQRQRSALALAAIAALPAKLREPAALFFIRDCSHRDIAVFLGLSVETVNNRLHAARSRLKERMLAMVNETFHARALPDDFANRIGRLIEARGAVVDALFDPNAAPEILSELAVSDEANRRAIVLQVIQLPSGGLVRGLAQSPVDALPRGSTVLSSGKSTETPANLEELARVVPQLAGTSPITTGAVQHFFLRAADGPWTASQLSLLDPFDVVIRFSHKLARAKVYPAVDVVTSRSRLFETNALGNAHRAIAQRARQALAVLWADDVRVEGDADALTRERALKLQNYFTQPFFVAERWTKRPGTTVKLADSLQTCRDILDGRYDDLPADTFYFSGDMAEIRGNIGRTLSFGPVTPPERAQSV